LGRRNQKSDRFKPDKFEDHYETALVDLINTKRSGNLQVSDGFRPDGGRHYFLERYPSRTPIMPATGQMSRNHPVCEAVERSLCLSFPSMCSSLRHRRVLMLSYPTLRQIA
jgi:hypothetical protein